jgi:hypothetical protein
MPVSLGCRSMGMILLQGLALARLIGFVSLCERV